MEFRHTEVFNINGAVRGMRNALNSHEKSDTVGNEIGVNDKKLCKSLIANGTSHRKFLRQIFVCVDITAPIYWWKQFDTYKVGVVSNSDSTMHTIHKNPLELSDFELIDSGDEDINEAFVGILGNFIDEINDLREEYLSDRIENRPSWDAMIHLLPACKTSKRTITMNYENILCMIEQRQSHKLIEWNRDFVNWTKTLPYSQEFFKQVYKNLI